MDLYSRLKAHDKPIVLYGMGNGADKIIEALAQFDVDINGVFVSDGFVRDKEFHGHKLCAYADAKEKYKNMIVLVSFGTGDKEVIANINHISKEQELYAPYVPVIGDGVFSKDYVKEHICDFEKVYERLADDTSRKTFENIIRYRISGELDYLFECEKPISDVYEILDFRDDEIYVDLGAYTGDTVAEFIEYAKEYSHIYALEPDAKTYVKLARNTEKLNNISLYNAAVHSEDSVLSFAMRAGRSSSISNSSEKTKAVQARSVDSILQGGSASYIKMDVEGAEYAAIEGAKRTIAEYKPRLAISCYHRIDDLFVLPQEVLSIRSDYKVYMRHTGGIPDWDSLYLFV